MRRTQLDSIRFFATAVIVLSHLDLLMNSCQLAGVFNNPTWGVDYFLILSGFGLFIAYENKDLTLGIKSSIKFALTKVKKIYVLYFITLIFCIPYSIYYDLLDCSWIESIVRALIKLIISATLLQTVTGLGATHYALNSPAWFLSCLFVAYMFVPIFICIVKKAKTVKKSVFGALCAYILIQIVSICLLRLENYQIFGMRFNALWYSSIYVRVWYVLLGMCIANICTKLDVKESMANMLEIVLAIIVLGWYVGRNYAVMSSDWKRCIDVLIASMTVFGFSFGKGVISKKILQKEFWISMGKKSWIIFLFQWPLIKLEYIFVLRYIENESALLMGILQLILFVISTVVLMKVYEIIQIKSEERKTKINGGI